jgi:ribosomal protein S18 acetylase RimI-like enzyme
MARHHRDGGAPWPRAGAAGLALRAVTDQDLPFLQHLYASTRQEELAVVPWPEGMKAAFLAQQFQAQHLHYGIHYADAERFVVEREGERIGRLYLHRRPHEHGVIDISLLPAWRGRGLGSALMADVLADAAAAAKPVRIYVEKNNPARQLYDGLGFRPIGEHGFYDHCEWLPDAVR